MLRFDAKNPQIGVYFDTLRPEIYVGDVLFTGLLDVDIHGQPAGRPHWIHSELGPSGAAT